MGGQPCPAGRPPASTRRSSCATPSQIAYDGKGVLHAVANVNGPIAKAILGMDALDQRAVDRTIIDLDGTATKSSARRERDPRRVARRREGGGRFVGQPLFRYLGGPNAHTLPVPMMNVFNGGAHADNELELQEFMLCRSGRRRSRRRCAGAWSASTRCGPAPRGGDVDGGGR